MQKKYPPKKQIERENNRIIFGVRIDLPWGTEQSGYGLTGYVVARVRTCQVTECPGTNHYHCHHSNSGFSSSQREAQTGEESHRVTDVLTTSAGCPCQVGSQGRPEPVRAREDHKYGLLFCRAYGGRDYPPDQAEQSPLRTDTLFPIPVLYSGHVREKCLRQKVPLLRLLPNLRSLRRGLARWALLHSVRKSHKIQSSVASDSHTKFKVESDIRSQSGVIYSVLFNTSFQLLTWYLRTHLRTCSLLSCFPGIGETGKAQTQQPRLKIVTYILPASEINERIHQVEVLFSLHNFLLFEGRSGS